MQAVILAAGMGRRLKELTRDNTKCMVKVNGVTLIERCLNQLDKLNLKKIIIVEGYQGKKLKEYIGTLDVKTPLEFINNPIYNKTNKLREHKPRYSFLDGPPYCSGRIHLGTAWNKTLKDAYLRFKSMSGYSLRRQAGWDTHGLPDRKSTRLNSSHRL